MEVAKKKLIGNEDTTMSKMRTAKGPINHISDVKGGEELEGFTGRDKRPSVVLDWLSQGQSFYEVERLES